MAMEFGGKNGGWEGDTSCRYSLVQGCAYLLGWEGLGGVLKV